jgi:hypothetical protein
MGRWRIRCGKKKAVCSGSVRLSGSSGQTSRARIWWRGKEETVGLFMADRDKKKGIILEIHVLQRE